MNKNVFASVLSGAKTRSKLFIKIASTFKAKNIHIYFFTNSVFASNANGSITRLEGTAAVGAYPRNLFVRALKFHKSCT